MFLATALSLSFVILRGWKASIGIDFGVPYVNDKVQQRENSKGRSETSSFGTDYKSILRIIYCQILYSTLEDSNISSSVRKIIKRFWRPLP